MDQRKAREEQIGRLEYLKAGRDGEAVASSLLALRRAAENPKESLMPPILSAVKAYATLGEIGDVFRQAWGRFEESTTIL